MGTRINLDYQVDNSQFDDKIKNNIKAPGGGTSSLEVVNADGDTMTGELKGPQFTLNSIYSADTATIYGSYAGPDSTMYIRFGNDVSDKLEIEYWNGSSADTIISIRGDKDFTQNAKDYTLNASHDVTFDVNNDLLLDVDTSITLDSPTIDFNSSGTLTADIDSNIILDSPSIDIKNGSNVIQLHTADAEINTSGSITLDTSSINLIQGNNRIRVIAGKWQFTNNNSDWFDFQTTLPIGTVLMYNGTGIADADIRTEDIGERGGDTIGKMPGWRVCNGNASTPNLFNRFIRSENASGNIGGSDDAIVVSHHHTINHTHSTSYATSSHVHGSSNMYADVHFDAANYIRWIARGSFTSTSHYACDIWHAGGDATASGVAISGNTNGPNSYSQPAYAGDSGDIGSSGTGANKPAYYSLIFIVRMS